MNKILVTMLGVLSWLNILAVQANEKFEILPDLPDVLSGAAQASSVTTVEPAMTTNTIATTQTTIGHEPSLVSLLFSLLFVILLIYATGIIYTKLNKLGLSTLKKQMGDINKNQVSVVSTTPLGGNKTLHVVELDGKRMLIGASQNSIHLIKDLGSSSEYIEDGEYSKIEIPNIKIPKIEIPKIEIPSINFSKLVTKAHKSLEEVEQTKEETLQRDNSDTFEISDIYEEENPDGIIDKLFQNANEKVDVQPTQEENEHKVDPDEFALYKKYL